MWGESLARQTDIQQYPENTRDIVQQLFKIRDINEGEKPVDEKLRAWIDDRLTALANMSQMNPEAATLFIRESRATVFNSFWVIDDSAPNARPDYISA